MEIEMESDDLTTHLSEEMISPLESAEVMGGMMSTDIVQRRLRTYIELEDDDESDESVENDENGEDCDPIITFYMDIREPLRSLQKVLEQKIGVDLKGYVFWLQNAQALELHKNLVDQLVKGEGVVQINLEIQVITQRINIVDVLKPTDAVLAASVAEEDFPKTINADSENININA